MGLGGARVLITGGSGGIGRCITRAYAAEGAHVAFTYCGNRTAADKQVAELGGRTLAVHMDLGDTASITAAADTVVAEFGGLDVLVHNAVKWEQWRERIEEWAVEDWRPTLRANIEGVFELTQRAAPELRASANGRVVFVSSSLVDRGMSGCWSYATSKAAGHGFARGLAWDLGRDGVLVNTVLPGMVLIDGTHRTASEEALVELALAQPAGRLPSGEDVAAAVVFLGSPANRVISGEILPVTGGTR